MIKEFHIRNYIEEDFHALLSMFNKLWTDSNEQDILHYIHKAISSDNFLILMAVDLKDSPLGFSIFSIRNDYVEGASASPTGYLEGIYIEDNWRQKGIARTLIQMGESWCKKQDCIQMGSDTWISDHNSRLFHQKMGFDEEDMLVHFIKNI